ncbi:MAG: YgaP-like transmembrane domain, partial [Dehalococcoidia bacterium]
MAERIVRIAAGLLVGLLGLLGWPVEVHGTAGLAVAVVTVLAVLDLTISGLIGYCPLYRFVPVPSPTGNRSERPEPAPPPPRAAGMPDSQDAAGRPNGGGIVRWLGCRLASPSWRRRLWGAGAAPLGLLAEAAAHAHGRVPLWLDRPLSIAPERGLELDYERFAELVVKTSGQLFAAGLRP